MFYIKICLTCRLRDVGATRIMLSGQSHVVVAVVANDNADAISWQCIAMAQMLFHI